MAITTYSNLKSAITNHLDRDDLDSHVDDFIDIAEARHKREIRCRDMVTRAPMLVANRYVDLPAGYLEAMSLRLLTDPVTVLDYLNLYEMSRRRLESAGKPVWFTVHSQLEFDRSPDQAYSAEIVYYKEFTALSLSNISNALLTRAPDIYLYSALAASAPFLMNDERVALWETLYKNAKDALNAMDRKTIGPIFARVAGATP